MPVREIPRNYRSLTGKHAAFGPNERATGFESSLERDLITVLQFMVYVKRWEEQPVEIRYLDPSGVERRYTPDFLIFHRRDIQPAREMPHVLCEVKYRDDLRAHWSEYKPKFRAARRYARERGWKFLILTELEIRTGYLLNARFLLPYRRHIPGPGEIKLLTEKLEELDLTTPADLIEACARGSGGKWERARLIATLWYMVAMRFIATDLSVPISMEGSEIWPGP